LLSTNERVHAVEPLRTEQYDAPATGSYLAAFAKLEARDPDAIAAFAAHVGKVPKEDRAVLVGSGYILDLYERLRPGVLERRAANLFWRAHKAA
jgi:hypothetical protein